MIGEAEPADARTPFAGRAIVRGVFRRSIDAEGFVLTLGPRATLRTTEVRFTGGSGVAALAFTAGRAAPLDLEPGLIARRSEETNDASCFARRSRDFRDEEDFGGAMASLL